MLMKKIVLPLPLREGVGGGGDRRKTTQTQPPRSRPRRPSLTGTARGGSPRRSLRASRGEANNDRSLQPAAGGSACAAAVRPPRRCRDIHPIQQQSNARRNQSGPAHAPQPRASRPGEVTAIQSGKVLRAILGGSAPAATRRAPCKKLCGRVRHVDRARGKQAHGRYHWGPSIPHTAAWSRHA